MFTHSIRWRLQLWFAFLLVCLLSGFGVVIYQLQRVNQFRMIDDELERRVAALDGAVRASPPFGSGPGHAPFERRPGRPGPEEMPEGPPPMRGGPNEPRPDWRSLRSGPREVRLPTDVSRLFDETRTNSFYLAIWSWDKSVLKLSTNAPPGGVPLPERPDRDTRTHTRTRQQYRETYHFTEVGDCVLAGRSIAVDLSSLHRFAWWLLAAGSTVLAFGLGGGWWLTTRAIRPVEEISAAASRISAGNLSERIRTADPDNELGQLAGVLNSTFARLEAAFEQQKQFTADASHELRTPLAVIISEAQTTLARERGAAEYRETVEACLNAAQQMRRLTESLLDLARFDAGHEPIERASIDVAAVARVCVERIRPLAAGRGIRIHCDLQSAETVGNTERIDQVITNLLANAIHYNKPEGEIQVCTRADIGAAILTVADTGVGIDADDIPHLFERFYRADKSRTRSDGRSGLGLAMCKAIVDAHGGSIEVASQPDVGTTFTVRLAGSPATR